MSSAGSRRAIVAGHGDFAAGIVSAVVQITGRDDVFIPITNRGLSAQDVERVIREQVGAPAEPSDHKEIAWDMAAAAGNKAGHKVPASAVQNRAEYKFAVERQQVLARKLVPEFVVVVDNRLNLVAEQVAAVVDELAELVVFVAALVVGHRQMLVASVRQ